MRAATATTASASVTASARSRAASAPPSASSSTMRANPQALIDREHRWDVHETPLGPLTLHAGAHGLTGVSFPGRGGPLDDAHRDPEALAPATRQLDEYFAQERTAFELPLDLR